MHFIFSFAKCAYVVNSLTGFLDLSLEDVGTSIELIYNPVRNGGLRGTPKSLMSDVVAPGMCYILLMIIIFEPLVRELIDEMPFVYPTDRLSRPLWFFIRTVSFSK